MSSVQLTRRIGMARGALFDLVTEPSRWPLFYNNMMSVCEGSLFEQPGDRVGFQYRILGRIVEAEARLIAIQTSEIVELETQLPDALTARQVWEFRDDADATLVTARLDTDDVTDWFGVPVDRYVVARSLQGDLSRTLENLADLVSSEPM